MYLYEQPRKEYNVTTTSMRRHDVASTLIRRCTCKLLQWEGLSIKEFVYFQYLNIMIVKVCNGDQRHPVLLNAALDVC